jgi:hypothetical protein
MRPFKIPRHYSSQCCSFLGSGSHPQAPDLTHSLARKKHGDCAEGVHRVEGWLLQPAKFSQNKPTGNAHNQQLPVSGGLVNTEHPTLRCSFPRRVANQRLSKSSSGTTNHMKLRTTRASQRTQRWYPLQPDCLGLLLRFGVALPTRNSARQSRQLSPLNSRPLPGFRCRNAILSGIRPQCKVPPDQ